MELIYSRSQTSRRRERDLRPGEPSLPKKDPSAKINGLAVKTASSDS